MNQPTATVAEKLFPPQDELVTFAAAVELPLAPTAETATAAIPAELPASTSEIEQTFIAIAEALEAAQADEEGSVRQILAAIITLPYEAQEAGLLDTEVEYLLEALFVELFEVIGIEYSPELVESFVKLTRLHYFDSLVENSAQEPAASEPWGDIGTHEFLQKIKQGLATMKHLTEQAYELGRSVLQLYRLQGLATPAQS